MSKTRVNKGKGFTLIELLIVVVILGILASIVLPQFSNASRQARENTLKDDLRYLRTQITVCKAQHRDVAPGYPGGSTAATPTEAAFLQHLTMYSTDAYAVSASASSTYKFGPYLTKMPPNPLSSDSSILIVANGASMPTPDGCTGWIYKPQTQELIVNFAGNDSNGQAFSSY